MEKEFHIFRSGVQELRQVMEQRKALVFLAYQIESSEGVGVVGLHHHSFVNPVRNDLFN